jgi:hypothetical protein
MKGFKATSARGLKQPLRMRDAFDPRNTRYDIASTIPLNTPVGIIQSMPIPTPTPIPELP